MACDSQVARDSALLKLDQTHQNEMFGRQILVKPVGEAEMIVRRQRRRGESDFLQKYHRTIKKRAARHRVTMDH